MKTCLFAPMFLEGVDGFGNDRLVRNIKYLNYYSALKEQLGFQEFWFADNASKMENVQKLAAKDVHIIQYGKRLSGDGGLDYPYCWRALNAMRLPIRMGYEKIIFIDTDMFVLSEELTSFIREKNTGWYTFQERRYDFPESSLQVLNKDCFARFLSFMGEDYLSHNGKMMEKAIPFTEVYKNFNVGRYGEVRAEQNVDMDAYGQCPTNIELVFVRD